ncbi:Zinc/iron permease [Bisporella sp. PMI_857]|nr:Zinc/iron permease [Bisporella sp. PMI_857]
MSEPVTCGNGPGNGQDYNMPFHIGALFIILFVSSTACAFPILAVRFSRLRIPPSFLFLARHFGTGVLLATAFVHLLPTAFISLTDKCLGPFWSDTYPAMAGAISLAAVFFVTVVEMVFSRGYHVCSTPTTEHSRPDSSSRDEIADSDTDRGAGEKKVICRNAIAYGRCAYIDQGCPFNHDVKPEIESTKKQRPQYETYGIVGPRRTRSNSTSREIQRIANESTRLDQIEESETSKAEVTPKVEPKGEISKEEDAVQVKKKALLQCLLLELGILFHSVFIGIALSVAIGSDFVVLLIAITFHQLFEGLALGSRIAALSWDKKSVQPWLMAIAYGCTTPIGQAIGLILHTSYDPESKAGLLMVGIMNAISSGLLIFASLVELMAEDFLSDESWETLRGKKRVGACFVVFLGATGMSTVGAWA